MPDLESALFEAFQSDPAPVVAFVAWMAGEHGLAGGPDVLDVGCGVGRTLRPLARLGGRVVGMEPDPAFRARAEEVARGEAAVTVLPGGFNDVAFDGAFDLVVGINSAFAHVADPAARGDALRRCWRALRPGGVLFLDLPNLLRILMEYAGPATYEAPFDGRPVRLVRAHTVDYHAATFTTHETYTTTGADGVEQVVRKDHPYAIVAYPDLAYQLGEAGFADLRTYRSYAARAPERLGEGRMMVSARRPPVPDA